MILWLDIIPGAPDIDSHTVQFTLESSMGDGKHELSIRNAAGITRLAGKTGETLGKSEAVFSFPTEKIVILFDISCFGARVWGTQKHETGKSKSWQCRMNCSATRFATTSIGTMNWC